jgi:hypothetical protein
MGQSVPWRKREREKVTAQRKQQKEKRGKASRETRLSIWPQ